MPILGILASAISGNLVPNSYESIATTTLSTTTATITFSSIPATFTHLQIRLLARTNSGGADNGIKIQFNSDTGSNYSYHTLFGNGSTTTYYGEANTVSNFIDKAAGGSAGASMFGAIVCDILDYANTNKYKTTRSLGGTDRNGSGAVFLSSGAWRNTNAITSITLEPFDSHSFVQYTQVALYGIKGA